MLLASKQNLEELIVRELAKKSSSSVKELKENLNFSIPALYKELKKLQEQGVLIKTKDKYSLSLSWILNLVELSDSIYDTYIDSASTSQILPEEGESKSFNFTSLSKVDDFWIHAMLAMLQNSDSKRLFQWVPHPWFYLINSHKSFPFHNALRTAGAKVDNIIGGNTFLDREGQKITTPGVYELNYAESKFQKNRTKYYSVSDTYLLTVHIKETKAREIDSFYNSINCKEDLNLSKIIDLNTRDAKTKITIEKNPAKVKKIWNTFINYFAISNDLKL